MTILRIQKKQDNFLVIDKTCLKDEKLSWGAKGLHAYLMSLPDDWTVRVSDLQKRAENGRDSVRSLINQLQNAGYIQCFNKRDKESGRFEGIEYLVLEIPDIELLTIAPEYSEDFEKKAAEVKRGFCHHPSPGNPAPGNPGPANPTLINNNKLSIEKLNNKTTATKDLKNKISIAASQSTSKAAAVIFSQVAYLKETQNKAPLLMPSSDESLIGRVLTPIQKQRVERFLEQINVSKKEALAEEIEYSLLSPQSFSACGNDFSKKLNAIRKVILRGDWQTPVNMLKQVRGVSKAHSSEDLTQSTLRQFYAEYQHFQRLYAHAKDEAKIGLEKVLQQVSSKIKNLEYQFQQNQALRSA